MAITPQHQAGEATEADLEKAYNRARSIGLFLVQKYAREGLRDNSESLDEFVMAMGIASFTAKGDDLGYNSEPPENVSSDLAELLSSWDDVLKLTGEPMRFTATGPIRREW